MDQNILQSYLLPLSPTIPLLRIYTNEGKPAIFPLLLFMIENKSNNRDLAKDFMVLYFLKIVI